MGAFGGGKELVIRVTLDSQGVVQGLDEINRKVEDSGKTADAAASGGFSRFQAAIVTLNSAVGLAKDAFNIAQGAFGTLIGAIEQGSAIGDVTESFRKLTEQAGGTADVFLGELTSATANTITNFDLQKKAIEAVRAGAKPDEFVELTKAARALAEQTGGDTLTEIDELSRAFETGRVMMLKNRLGVIDVEKAQDDFATQLGTTRDKLTEQQQLLATRTALLEAMRAKTAEVGTITKDAGDRVATFSTVLSNAKDRFLEAATNSQGLNDALAALEKVISEIDFQPIIDALVQIIDLAGKTIAAMAKVSKAIAAAFDTRSAAQRAFSSITERADDFKNKIDDLISRMEQAGPGGIDRFEKEFQSLRKEFGNVSGAIDQDVIGKVQALEQTFSDTVRDLKPKAEEIATAIGGTGAGTATSASGGVAGAVKKTEETVTALKETSKTSFEEMSSHVDKYKTTIEESSEAWSEWEQIGINAIDTIINALSDGFQRGDIGTVLGSLGGDIGGTLGGDLGRTIGNAIGSAIGNALSSLGGDNAGTKARKAADKYFADIFDADRLSIIVGNQLRHITDLVFEGNTPFGGNVDFGSSAFAQFLQSLPETAQAAFNGVGLAFGILLGDIERLGGTLGAVFANNIGGSLNNLQLLIQATGLTADQLKEQLVGAFLDGKISALEAFSAMRDIENIMKEGIPDGIGLVDQAFSNLKAAGEKGGRAAVDALKDIGAEAAELGITTIPQLAANLEATGKFSAEEIQKLLNALAAFGIDTVEELKGISAETAIAILANLEANKFPFEEIATQVEGVKNDLDAIPETTRKDLIFDVRVNVSDADRKVIEAGYGRSGPGIGYG